jgi:signal transduction histidine kinase
MAVRQRLARPVGIYEDRDRIARNLPDHVIQRLFAARPALQALLPRLSDAVARSRRLGVIGQVDQRGKVIRTTIFDLRTIDYDGSEPSLRRRLLDVVVEVLDDGRGIDERGARSGLGNLGQRAAATARSPCSVVPRAHRLRRSARLRR